jgi:hypothetical protein
MLVERREDRDHLVKTLKGRKYQEFPAFVPLWR